MEEDEIEKEGEVEVLSKEAKFWQDIIDKRKNIVEAYEDEIKVEKVLIDAAQLQLDLEKSKDLNSN